MTGLLVCYNVAPLRQIINENFKTGDTAGRERFESFEKCHFEERERREILRMAVCSRFLPSVEMTKTAVIQSSRFETVPYKHSPCSWFMVWTVPRTVRKAARSGTAPYNHPSCFLSAKPIEW